MPTVCGAAWSGCTVSVVRHNPSNLNGDVILSRSAAEAKNLCISSQRKFIEPSLLHRRTFRMTSAKGKKPLFK
jgi:hypothetical protein